MLDSKLLKYENFIDPRKSTVSGFTEGFSGELLWAIATDGRKFVVKHISFTDAANEFVACTLAKYMGIPVPKAELLSPNKRFNSRYAVAIEYIEGLERLTSYEGLTTQEKKDICSHYTFAMLIGNMDIIEMYRHNGRIVALDFGESFTMSGLLESAYKMDQDKMIKELLDNSLDAFCKDLSYMDFDFPELAASLGMSTEEVATNMRENARCILTIPENEIQLIDEELAKLYPEDMVKGYMQRIDAMKQQVAKI